MGKDLEDKFPGGTWVETLVRQSLAEDVGPGDVSTDVSVDSDAIGRGTLVSRDQGIVAGLPLLDLVYRELDPRMTVEKFLTDGARVAPGTEVARISGPVGSILTGERTALNFLQHLGGIATVTGRYVEEVSGTSCRVLDTRKTLPGYRALAKYAVLCGGGRNHRMGLFDRVLLKDNHWAAAADSIISMVARAREEYPGLAIEVEVDTLKQLGQVLPLKVEWILLDNFTVADTAAAVRMRNSSPVETLLESSGNITLDTIARYAQAGVDGASVGRLTHSAKALDLGLDLETP